MQVDISLPEEYTGAVTGDLTRRRGVIRTVEMEETSQRIQASVPLSGL